MNTALGFPFARSPRRAITLRSTGWPPGVSALCHCNALRAVLRQSGTCQRLRIAFLSPPFSSHLQAMGAMAAELARRGHQCFFLGHPGLASDLPASLTLIALDARSCAWSPGGAIRNARRPAFPFGVRSTVADMAAMTRSLVEQGPVLLRSAAIDAVVCDQMEAAGALLSEHLDLPFVSVAVAAPINREPMVPLPVLDWPYDNSEAGSKRNRIGERIADWLTSPHDRVIAHSAEQLGCTPKERLVDCLSPLLQVAQLTAGFDFPRHHLPNTFHYVGALRPSGKPAHVQPIPKIGNDRPFVFASLGTLQGHRLGLFQRIAKACRMLDMRLMIAHCGGLSANEAQRLDADFVVDRVSQAEALARADLVITHAGLNTVLDAIAAGVPMLCIPLAFDQPGMAARVRRAGLGEVVSPRSSAKRLAKALDQLLQDRDPIRTKGRQFAEEMQSAGGTERAAVLIERAFRTRQPVLPPHLGTAA